VLVQASAIWGAATEPRVLIKPVSVSACYSAKWGAATEPRVLIKPVSLSACYSVIWGAGMGHTYNETSP
jgi:hypothetical protein